MGTQSIENPDGFIGRVFEQQSMLDVFNSDEAAILVVYGRRRVGKTELIEHVLSNKNLIKLEGVEKGDKSAQMYRVLYQLGKFCNEPHFSRLQFFTWLELLDFVADQVQEGQWVLYFEELQWLAEYKHEFIADLKYVWDNRLRHNAKLTLVLCGSSPSFMINEVLHSKALYNRSVYELKLQEFSLAETRDFLSNRCPREVMDAYLTLGGIPEYLKRLKPFSSVFLGICALSFKKQAFFSQEYQRIFISSFADSSHYRNIIEYLSAIRFASRQEIENHLKVKGGGKLTDVLTDLQQCGFIEKYTPYYTTKKSKLVRYCISDNYLRFYYKFINPIREDIDDGRYNDEPCKALSKASYQIWLGYAFERFIRKNHRMIAKNIGFSAVHYKSGVYFSRATEKNNKGFQIDLIFDRADHVLTVCEVRYTQSPVGVEVIAEVESKLNAIPEQKDKTIERVLISAQGVSDSVKHRRYFDHIITFDDLFND